MKRAALLIAALLACAAPGRGADDNPHQMVDAQGALDNAKCGLCHEDDFTLSRSPLETCTMCHAASPHAGATEHLRASAAEVQDLLGAEKGGIEIPLTETGTLYCASCHLYHDPAVAEEAWLERAWVPSPTDGLAAAVRNELSEEFAARAAQAESGAPTASLAWMKTGTRLLRLPVEDGSLCLRCHAGLLR